MPYSLSVSVMRRPDQSPLCEISQSTADRDRVNFPENSAPRYITSSNQCTCSGYIFSAAADKSLLPSARARTYNLSNGVAGAPTAIPARRESS